MEAMNSRLYSEKRRKTVSSAYTEPLERFLQAFQPNTVLLVLHVDPKVTASGWLTETRIARHLHASLMEPVCTEVWPLLENVWIISLLATGDLAHPTSSLHVHSLKHTLAERIDTEWRQETGITLESGPLPAFSLTPVAAVPSMHEMEDNISELNELLDIIVNKQLHAQFQPIVNLRDGQVFGYEALIRGPKGGTLRRPGALFRAAAKARMVSWFDLACQEQCFARAAELELRHLLFINMEAEGLAFLDMHDRPLATRARDCGLTPDSIVIEITERQAVDDFPKLMAALNHLREQGFKIAIDDAGAGYNSLHAIAEIRPDFVKIDRSLVRNLDVNGERRALLSTLVRYARNIGTHILAEGSETREELGTLIDLGVTYGQGYLMGKPHDTFRGIARETREFICNRQQQQTRLSAGRSIPVGGLARAGKVMTPDTPLASAASSFFKNPSLTSIVIAENKLGNNQDSRLTNHRTDNQTNTVADNNVRGLLMRESLEHILDMARSAHMEELLPDETVTQWMQTNFLRARQDEAVEEVARQATTRSDISLESDIVVVDSSNSYVGVLPMRVLMEAVTNVQENRNHYADPLTGLPNRVMLEQTVSDRLLERSPLAMMRIDLTGLAAYNRASGFPHGDNVIRSLAYLINQSMTATKISTNDAPAFVAHLGGDDFVVLTTPEGAIPLCEAVLQNYGREQSAFYTPEQVRSGVISLTERNGNMRQHPLMACSIAVVTNRNRRYSHLMPMLDEANLLLRQLKARSGNAYAIDRLLAS